MKLEYQCNEKSNDNKLYGNKDKSKINFLDSYNLLFENHNDMKKLCVGCKY